MIRRQRGVALIMALMVFAIVSGVAVSVLSSVNRTLTTADFAQREARHKETLLGGEAWAVAWFSMLDNENSPPLTIDWQAPWRLARQDFPLEDVDQRLTIEVIDRQTCLNVNALAPEPSREVMRQRLMRLSSVLSIDSRWVDYLIDWVDADQSLTTPGSREDEYYLGKQPPYRTGDTPLSSLSELELLAVDQSIQASLAPYICALPIDSGVNINRMSGVVLETLLPDISADQRASIEAHIQTTGYQSVDEFLSLDVFEDKALEAADWRVDSRFVDVFVTLTDGDYERILHSQLAKTDSGSVAPVTRSFGAFGVLSDALLAERQQE